MSDDLVSGWSCDQRHRGDGCRDPHGCHCREITAQNADIAVKDLAVAEAARSMHKLMTRAIAAESELSTLRAELDVANANHRQMAKQMADLAREHDTLRARVREVVGPLARLTVPEKPQGNAGAYSIFHNDIRAARQLMEEVK